MLDAGTRNRAGTAPWDRRDPARRRVASRSGVGPAPPPVIRTGTRCRAANGAWNMSPFCSGAGGAPWAINRTGTRCRAGAALGTCPRSCPVRDHAGPRDEAIRSASRKILLGGLVSLCEAVIHSIVFHTKTQRHKDDRVAGRQRRMRFLVAQDSASPT